MVSHDVIVIGAGLAGLRAALEAAPFANVGVITKVYPIRSHSVAAQGGVNAAIGEDDSWEQHAYDTVKGGDFLVDQNGAETLCREGPGDVIQMERYGTLFSRDENGRIAQRPFGGQDFPRTCYAQDKTGYAMLHALYEQALKAGVQVYSEWQVVALCADGGRCRGVAAMRVNDGAIEGFSAKAVVLCTGGYGRVFQTTTNAMINTGDGMALAYRAGVGLKDMEFVQFHPTTLFPSGILLSEGARGEGGYLVNESGERFMERYLPQKMELGPRDLVSRAMTAEIEEGRGSADGYLYLDLRHLGEGKIKERLPQVREIGMSFAGADAAEEPLPVRPGQHYSMGGIPTTLDGESPLEGLYAAGEAACVSVHGANRLGGNSLLETIVFGRRAGRAAAAFAVEAEREPVPDSAVVDEEKRIAELLSRDGSERVSPVRGDLERTANELLSVHRTAEGTRRAIGEIAELKERYNRISLADRSRRFNLELSSVLELGFLLDVAETIAAGAHAREESRGAHYRLDFPKRDDEGWLKHTLAFQAEGGPRLEYAPVAITRWQPEERTY